MVFNMRGVSSLLRQYLRLAHSIDLIHSEQERMLIVQAMALLERQVSRGRAENLREVEFKVFSQFGEDGIIQYLMRQVGPLPMSFVEFGVQNYSESNTRFLLMKDLWRGMVIDSSRRYIKYIRNQEYYWRHSLEAVEAFITKGNINSIISGNGFAGQIGLMSIDIDGNDYWVWQAIDCIDPVVVVIEYNSVFGSDLSITIPYSESFSYLRAHYSGLYWGASLRALSCLAQSKGYVLAGCNTAGNNAFFVKKERASQVRVLEPQEAFRDAVFRISRDRRGRLSYLNIAEQRAAIRGMPVLDIETGRTVPLQVG